MGAAIDIGIQANGSRMQIDDRGIGVGLGGFAEDVGIDQVGHKVSVDSDSTRTK